MAKAAMVPQRSKDLTARVVPVSLGLCNVYFIQTDDGHILVDTGMPGNGKALQGALSRAGIEPQDVKLIMITHAHLDHVGSVAHAKHATGAKVLCHEYAAPYIRAGVSSPIIAHAFWAKLLSAIWPSRYKGVEPDITIGDELDLQDYGIAGKVIHTPGHTQGSLTIVLENGEMLLGDLLRETRGQIHVGTFYEDHDALVRSLETLAAFRPTRVYMSHGTFLDKETFQQRVATLREGDHSVGEKG